MSRINSKTIPASQEADYDTSFDVKTERRIDYRSALKNEVTNKRHPPRGKLKRKKKTGRDMKIKPHTLKDNVDCAGIYDTLIASVQDCEPATLLAFIETFISTKIMLGTDSNILRALIAIFEYGKLRLKSPACILIYDYLKLREFEFDFMKDWNLPEFISFLRSAFLDWETAKLNEGLQSIISLLTYIVTLGFIDPTSLDFNYGKFEIFRVSTQNIQVKAVDFVDALWQTLIFISESAVAIASGDLRSVLNFDANVTLFENSVFKLKKDFDFVLTGNYTLMDGDQHTFEKELLEALEMGKKMKSTTKGPLQTRMIAYYRELETMHAKFVQVRVSGDLREAPFSYLIYGSSSVGKSTLGSFLMRYILEVNGHEHKAEYLTTLNSSDKFFSGYKSYVNGVFLDDFANNNAAYVEKSPCNTLLEFVNNVPLQVLQAEVELKGRVTAEPKCVGITTNIADLDSSTYSNEPASIMRRVSEHFHVRVKPKYTKFCQDPLGCVDQERAELDADRIAEDYPDWGNPAAAYAATPDIWLIDVYNVEIYPHEKDPKTSTVKSTHHRGDPWKLVPVRYKSKILKDIGLKELQEYVREKSAAHFALQKKITANDKKMNAPHVCSECKYHIQDCECSEPTIKPHGSLDLLKSSTFASYVHNSTKNDFRTDLREFVSSWLWEGKIHANHLRKVVESHTSQAFIVFLERLREVLRLYCIKYKMNDVMFWMPHWIEDTDMGTYLNVQFRKKTMRLFSAGDFLFNSVKCGIGGVLPFYFLPLPYATATSALALRYIPPNICTELVCYTAKHCILDQYKPLQSIASFWFNLANRKLLTPYVFNPVLRYNPWIVKLYNSVYARRKLNGYFKRAQHPVVRAFFGLGSMMIFPCASARIVMCGTISCFLRDTYFRKDSSNVATRALWGSYKTTNKNAARDVVVPSIISSYLLYAGIPSLYQILTGANEDSNVVAQSRLDPTPEEIRKNDADLSRKDFKPAFEDRLLDPVPCKISRRSGEVGNLVMKNLCFVRRNDDIVCNGLILASGLMLLPHHMMKTEATNFTFTRKANTDSKCGNAQFKSLLGAEDFVRVGDHDLVVAYVPQSGDNKNIVDVFATRVPEVSRSGKMYLRLKDGTLKIMGISDITPCTTTNNHSIFGRTVKFPGLAYNCVGNREGMCMAPIVADDHQSYILGVHLGGDGVRASRAGSPTATEIHTAIATLCDQSHVSPITAEGNYITKQFGVDTLTRTVHQRSPLVMLEGNRNYRLYGSTVGRAQMTSRVIDTPICDSARKLLGITDSWGAPRFRGPDKNSPWVPWLTSLKDSTNPSIGFEGKILKRAADDYMSEIEALLLEDISFWKNDVQVLTRAQVVNGIPGKRFIDAIKASTSVGFPIGGTKTKWLTRSTDPSGTYQDYDVLDEKFWIEAERMEEEYLSDRRCYPVFKASCKDEPTLDTVTKVRIFQAAPISFQLVIRKYYLPIARFMSLNPLICECAVGVNPASKEWNELGNHIRKFGEQRVLAIDYKKYDLRMPAQLTFCALKIMRKIGALCGYTPDDLKIMEGIATDICWPMSAYNGDMVMLIGSNPSGQNLTVYLNGIVNSLLHRMGFFHIYPRERRTFRQSASLITYGDDAAGSVDWYHSNYNMIALRDFFAKHDIVITMAEKEADFKKFIPMKDCDFLKRKFVYRKEFGGLVGPLKERSINKSLCSILRSSEVSPEEVSAANICGAADEYFFHGQSVFEQRQAKLMEISEIHGLNHMTRAVSKSYKERLRDWKAQNA